MTRDSAPGRRPRRERPKRPDAEPQQLVAQARAQVLGGRGPDASQAEVVRVTGERPTLGPLPAPLERELVHLHTDAFRSGGAPDVAASRVRQQFERLSGVWGAARPTEWSRHRSVLLATNAATALACTVAVAGYLRRRRQRH